jgi:hypothetical protein
MYGNGIDLEWLVEARLQEYAAEVRNIRILRELAADKAAQPSCPSWFARCGHAIQAPARRFHAAGG